MGVVWKAPEKKNSTVCGLSHSTAVEGSDASAAFFAASRPFASALKPIAFLEAWRQNGDRGVGGGKGEVGGYPRMLNTRREGYNSVSYSYLDCFVNTFSLNMYVSISYTGLTRRNTFCIFSRLPSQEYVNTYSTRKVGIGWEAYVGNEADRLLGRLEAE